MSLNHCFCLLYTSFVGVEILALQVFDEGEFSGGFVVGFDHHCGDFGFAEELKRAESSLARDKLISVRLLSDDDGLHKTVLLDGLRKLTELFLREVFSRLIGVSICLLYTSRCV